MKRGLSYGFLLVAVVAVVFGVIHANGSSPRNSSPNWLTKVAAVANQTPTNATMPDVGQTTQTSSVKAANHTQNPLPPSAATFAAVTTATASATTAANTPTANKSATSTTSANKSATTTAPANATPAANTAIANVPATAPPAPNLGDFTLILSENHGAKVLAVKHVAIVQGENLMQYMHQNFSIVTGYGDGFMIAIDGIHSQWTDVPVTTRQPVDWFFYVNGQQAPVGAGSVVPRAGDVETWDYHRWDPSTGK